VFLRVAVSAVITDSPQHAAYTDVKRGGGSTHYPCTVCDVTQEELREGDFDVEKFRRTPEQIEDALFQLEQESNRARREKLSTELGVVHSGIENPFRAYLHLNLISQFPTDIFHQDALVRGFSM